MHIETDLPRNNGRINKNQNQTSPQHSTQVTGESLPVQDELPLESDDLLATQADIIICSLWSDTGESTSWGNTMSSHAGGSNPSDASDPNGTHPLTQQSALEWVVSC